MCSGGVQVNIWLVLTLLLADVSAVMADHIDSNIHGQQNESNM